MKYVKEHVLGIPCLIASNSRNENAEPIFGMNDAGGIFSTWPGTLGLAAAAKGDIKNGGDASLLANLPKLHVMNGMLLESEKAICIWRIL